MKLIRISGIEKRRQRTVHSEHSAAELLEHASSVPVNLQSAVDFPGKMPYNAFKNRQHPGFRRLPENRRILCLNEKKNCFAR